MYTKYFFCSVVLKYLKSNGKVGTTSFAKVPLTDGKEHYILLHFSGLQKGTPTTTLYVDCKLVERVQDVPQAFKSLPQGPKRITLKTLSTSNQVNLEGRTNNIIVLIGLSMHTVSCKNFTVKNCPFTLKCTDDHLNIQVAQYKSHTMNHC